VIAGFCQNETPVAHNAAGVFVCALAPGAALVAFRGFRYDVDCETMIELITRHRAEVESLCRQYRARRLDVFGSAAGDRFDPKQSDLDFLVDFEPMSPSLHSKSYFGLWFALQDLFGRQVDLVESAAISNPYFLKRVNDSRQVLYAA